MKAVNPSRADFQDLSAAANGGPVPFVVRLPNDMLTPVSVYANLRAASPHAFFLESAETGARVGRYSFMGAAPRATYSCREGTFRKRGADGQEETWPCTDPLAELREAIAPWRARWAPDLELPPLVGGVVGYLGYDYVHYFEPVGAMLPDTIGLPEMHWALTDKVVCFDHLHSTISVSKCVPPAEVAERAPGELYDALVAEMDEFVDRHLRPATFHAATVRQVLAGLPDLPDFASNHTEASFCAVVERARGHIRAGDIFQVVPSQRLRLPLAASALDVYRALRKINPSAYMFALRIDGHEVVGSSPETQLRCQDGQMMMRPLAGSRPRTGDREADAAAARALVADAKELAEHRMLVDLVRNDLGRVATPGSVAITRLLEVESYSHVMHLTSEVTARLDDAHDVIDAIRATFPAGTLSGAPKVRAMQLINDFEDCRRNVYGGLVGYIDHQGNSDSCIAIRMMVAADGVAHVQAGGGLVADSVPATEYQETLAKASAVLHAIAVAEAQA